MQWQDSAIILGIFPLGESSQRVVCLTKHNGLHAGLYRKKKNNALFLGDKACVTWQGRLAEQLGTFTIEVEACVYSQTLYDRKRLLLLSSLADLLMKILPDCHAYPAAYDALCAFLYRDFLTKEYLSLYIYFEIFLLKLLGFPLELDACAVSGKTTDLIYVSPSSGRAVSRDAAGSYVSKMLHLPEFLTLRCTECDEHTCYKALNLTGFFISKHLFRGHPLPQSRTLLLNTLKLQRIA